MLSENSFQTVLTSGREFIPNSTSCYHLHAIINLEVLALIEALIPNST